MDDQVEFVGGPFDGRTMNFHTDHTRRPPHVLYLAVPPDIDTSFLSHRRDPVYLPLMRATYYSAGPLSDDTHRWPYRYRGMQ